METCLIEGCDRPLRRKKYGWCELHFTRWRRHGDPLITKRILGGPPADRFWVKVTKTARCWLWTGATDTNGYGAFRIDGKTVKAHRYSFTLHVGTIPDEYWIDHRCGVRNCVNPAHLQAVPPKLNGENRISLNTNNNSGYAGVHWSERDKRWIAQVMHNRQRHCAGYYRDAESAAQAARDLRLELFTNNLKDRAQSS